MRNPIGRTISQYRSLRNPSNYEPNWRDLYTTEQVAALDFCQAATFSDVIHCTEEAVLGHFVNVQTRMLSDHEVKLHDLMSADLRRKVILESACENLVGKIDFLGIHEMMYSSLALLKQETGIDGAVAHLNASIAYDVDLSPRDLARLRDLLDLDLQLYELALGVFRRRVDCTPEGDLVCRGAVPRTVVRQRC